MIFCDIFERFSLLKRFCIVSFFAASHENFRAISCRSSYKHAGYNFPCLTLYFIWPQAAFYNENFLLVSVTVLWIYQFFFTSIILFCLDFIRLVSHSTTLHAIDYYQSGFTLCNTSHSEIAPLKGIGAHSNKFCNNHRSIQRTRLLVWVKDSTIRCNCKIWIVMVKITTIELRNL